MRRFILISTAAAVAVAAIFFFSLPRVPVLIIRNDQGKVLARLVCEDGKFVHRYVHSVHLSNVDEEYSIERDGALRLTASRFDTLGVGIPYDADEGFSLEGNRFVLKMDRLYRSLPVRVSPLPGHVIITGGRAYPLSEWLGVGELAVIDAKIMPRFRVPARAGTE